MKRLDLAGIGESHSNSQNLQSLEEISYCKNIDVLCESLKHLIGRECFISAERLFLETSGSVEKVEDCCENHA